MQTKTIIFKQDAQQRMLVGIEKLYQAVTTTLGPRGANVAIERKYGAPTVLHDGVSVAKQVILDDPYENMGAQLVKQAAEKTNDVAGDGTTTATLLAYELCALGMKHITAGSNPMMLRKGIDIAVSRIVGEITKQAKPVEQSDWVKIATISAQNAVIGQRITEAITLVGKDGVVEVQEGQSLEIEIVHTEGMSLERGFASPYFVSNPDSMEAYIDNPSILVTDQKINSIDDILPFLEGIISDTKDIVIICDDIDDRPLSVLVMNKLKGIFNVLVIKAPGFGPRRKEMLHDIAVVTGANFISAEAGRELSSATIEDCGHATAVRAGKDSSTIIGGAGKREDIDKRIKLLKSELASTTQEFDQEKIRERLAKLSKGIAIIKVGAATESELKELKERVKDAKEATKAAIDGGIVPGGGVTYLRASESLSEEIDGQTDDDVKAGIKIVKEVLSIPIMKLAENCGENGGKVLFKILSNKNPHFGFNAQTLEYGDMLTMGVIDPAKVAKQALINAASAAGSILTTRCAIALNREDKKED